MPVLVLGDIWKKKGFKVIPTNTIVGKGDKAVMGRGLARQASDKMPRLKRIYGRALVRGNTIDGFYVHKKLILLPVKTHWKHPAIPEVIERSLQHLNRANELGMFGDSKIYMPMVGCGFGGLKYEQVLPLLLQYWLKQMRLIIPPNTLYGKDKYRSSFLPGASGLKDQRVSLSGKFDDVEI